jgi:hypothetical protein
VSRTRKGREGGVGDRCQRASAPAGFPEGFDTAKDRQQKAGDLMGVGARFDVSVTLSLLYASGQEALEIVDGLGGAIRYGGVLPG